ncbi:THUMP domain-containing protein 1 homolog [Homalodisca vitripennis]|uniref:THUMP domain-containing protein 1 homolog n=1 Tax=Homalodisca vitripennis TaxID=197043 RepID=UPI001EEAEBD0|nr:THUMP domain-containing protein 1 homolog [Homalodisca vitripennis]
MDQSYKRKNNYYNKPGRGRGDSSNWNNKRKFKHYLQPGLKGFICTCNMREKDCVRESYNILNEYADKLYGLEEMKEHKSDEKVVTEEAGAGAGAEEDIEDELKKEVSSLKATQSWRYPSRFTSIDTGIKNNIFIKTTVEDPVKLAMAVLNDVAVTKTQKGRFLLRIIPVEVTCKASLEDIKTAADALFDKHFRCEPTTFAIVVNKRYNDSLLRDEVIHSLALLVTDKNQDHKANLKEAKKTVLLEIMKGVCCLSVLEDYKRLRHYNLAELAKPEVTEAEGNQPEDTEEVKEEEENDQGEASENEEDDVEKECQEKVAEEGTDVKCDSTNKANA